MIDRGPASEILGHKGRVRAGIAVAVGQVTQIAMADTHSSSAPQFLNLDPRVPAAIRDLLSESDGCLRAGFLTGGTVCAQRAIQTLLIHEAAEGASYEARLHALSQKYPSVPQSLFALCIRLGESASKEHPALDVERLRVLTVALKIMLYEIYVLGPDRVERLKYLQQLLESVESGSHGHKSTVVAFPNG